MKILLLLVALCSVHCFPFLERLLSKPAPRLSQAAFPIPEVPDNYEVSGTYSVYNKQTKTLEETGQYFLVKYSADLNTIKYEKE